MGSISRSFPYDGRNEKIVLCKAVSRAGSSGGAGMLPRSTTVKCFPFRLSGTCRQMGWESETHRQCVYHHSVVLSNSSAVGRYE